MLLSELALRLNKIIKPASQFSLVLGTVSLGIMMLTVVVDALLRGTISKLVPGSIDIIGLCLIIVFFCGYAYIEIKGQHIRVDVLVGRLPPTVQQIVTTNGYFLTLGITAIISWQFIDQALFLANGHDVTSLLRIPTWPFTALAAFFIAIFALAVLANLLTHLAELGTTMKGRKGYLWLLPGIGLVSGLFVFSLWPDLIPFEVTASMWGSVIFSLLFVLIFSRVHIGAAMAMVALLGISYLSGAEGGLADLAMTAMAIGGTYTWSVVPLFCWMGLLVYHAGFAAELYATAHKWIGHIHGGLASATTAACAGLAAMVGGTMTGVLAMGQIALPEMRKYKYDMKLATATIVTASTIGSLIPPSIDFIIFGMLTRVSISKLFLAGVFPGILFTVILIIMITIQCRLNPKLGPPGPKAPMKERISSIKDVWAVALLVMIVMGGLYMGVFTPTEAGAVGAFGALTIGFARRRLSLKAFTDSAFEAVQTTGMIMFIFVFAISFSHFIATTQLTTILAQWIIGLNLSPLAIISIILFIYMILGCIMNATPAVIITIPIFFPIAMNAGFDPVWFGVLVTVMVELAQITPPIGMNVFAMSAIARDVPMYSIFRGVLPFWGAFLVLVVILVAFPQISLFLPNLMG